MKVIISFLFAACTFFFSYSMQDMITAMKNGDSNALAAHFDSRVEVTIGSSSKNYTKTNAAQKVRDVFEEIDVNDFQVIHKSESNGSQYFIGTLKGKKGSYRTTLYVVTKNNRQLIQEIKFER